MAKQPTRKTASKKVATKKSPIKKSGAKKAEAITQPVAERILVRALRLILITVSF